MEPVLTPQQMQQADEATIAAGTPGRELMDRAAHACAVAALRRMGGGYGRRVVVVCGKGNNGGDGIAAARHLANAGVRSRVLLIGDPEGDPAWHLDLVRRSVPEDMVRFEAFSPAAFDRAAVRADLAIDAVFGTGFSGAPRDEPEQAIGCMERSDVPVLAVDIEEAALEATRANAAANEVTLDRVERMDLRAKRPPVAETIAANLMRTLLLRLASVTEDRPETLIVSGLLDEEGDEVAAAFAPLEERGRLSSQGWSALLLSR
jgi:hydroxyethylthiazole kinase-like uncharacterized protein yjeF